MSKLDDDVWNAVIDAGGGSPAQRGAAEQLLAHIDAEPLPAPRIDEIVAHAVAARAAADARVRSRTPWGLPVALMAAMALGLLAAVGPNWLWPERSASVLTLDCGAAVMQAMTDSDDEARYRAVSVLEDKIWQSLEVLLPLVQGQDPTLATVAANSLGQLRSAMLAPTGVEAAEGDLDAHCAIAADVTGSQLERSFATIHIGRWVAQAAHALRSAPLLDAGHAADRAIWQSRLREALTL